MLTPRIYNIFSAIFVAILLFYGISVPTYLVFMGFIVFGLLGWKNQFFARFFIFCNISYAVFSVFYAPTISFSILLFPDVQPKPIALLLLTVIISALAGILLNPPEKVDFNRFSIYFSLSLILTWIFFHLFNKLAYESYSLYAVLLVLSISINEIFSNFAIYNFKKYHLRIALFLFLVFTFLNITTQDRHTKSLGIVKNHSVWAKDENPYNQYDWTLRANYSYSLFIQLLSLKYKVIPLESEYDWQKSIIKCDTILILTPTIPFSLKETKILQDYAENGGKVLFVADHTDLYGHARVINEVIKKWGISVNYDAVFSPVNHYAKIKLRNTLGEEIRPLTGSSLLSFRPSYIMAWSHNWVSEAANYNEPNFFGDMTWTGEDRYGDFPIAAISNVGAGYVTIFTDSTVFANFALFQPQVLKTLSFLIEKGSFLSKLAFYYPFLLGLFLLGFIINDNRVRTASIIGLFISSTLTGGIYLLYNIQSEGFYPSAKQIKIFCKEEYIRESLPNQGPKKNVVSNLYSNMARFDLYPEWKGEFPSECFPDEKCIWFTTYAEYAKRDGYKPQFIIILDDSNGLRKLGYEKKEMGTDYNRIGLKEYANNRLTWVMPNSAHTITVGKSNIFSGFGLIDDITLGNWWTSTEVSPFRMEMIKRFSDWVKYQRDILSYRYPPVGIREGNKNMIVTQKEGKTTTINNIDLVPIERNNHNYIYLGGELWGIIKQENNEISIIGGPETSDNYLKYRKNRFLGLVKKAP